jgi:hypothetical protein
MRKGRKEGKENSILLTKCTELTLCGALLFGTEEFF